MAIKKIYVSDFSGEEIEGNPTIITLSKRVTKTHNYGYGRPYRYTITDTTKFHITEKEFASLPQAIQDYFKPPKEKKKDEVEASSKRTTAKRG